MEIFPEGFEKIVNAVSKAAGKLDVGWMLIGAASVAAWGKPRATTDVDAVFALDLADSRRLDTALKKAGFKKTGGPQEIKGARGLFLSKYLWKEVSVDLFFTTTEWQVEAMGRRRKVIISGRTLWLVSPEDLILYKTIAARGKDLDDIAGVLEERYRRLDWPYIARWGEELGLLSDLTDIVDSFKAEHGLESEALPWES